MHSPIGPRKLARRLVLCASALAVLLTVAASGAPWQAVAEGGASPAQTGAEQADAMTIDQPIPDASVPATTPTIEPAEPPRPASGLWPRLDGAALAWFAVVVVLMLTFRLKPLLSERNLDGLVLVATCLLLVVRYDTTPMPKWAGGLTAQWWSYGLLSLATLYWLLRGLRCFGARTVARQEPNASRNALFILVLAGLAVGIGRVTTDPLSPTARDGIVGGLAMADTGKLPYGDAAGHDRHGPLLYALYAGTGWIAAPTATIGDAVVETELTWANRATWLGQEWWREGHFVNARLAHGLLYVLFLLATYLIGRRMHSDDMGLTLVAIFCVFPATFDAIAQPEVLLPATLLAWSVAFALMPTGVAGLVSTLTAVLAGLAWPWAWLMLPVLLGYFLRRGLDALGGVAGTLGGTAAILAGLTWLTNPTPPRADGALHRAALVPEYAVCRSEDGRHLVVTTQPAAADPPRGWLTPLWKWLVTKDDVLLDAAASAPDLSPVELGDIDVRKVFYRTLETAAPAREEMIRRYRLSVSAQPGAQRMLAAVRTVLEHTWLAAGEPPAGLPGTWALWAGGARGDDGWWSLAHRAVKVMAGLLAVFIGLSMLRGQAPQPHHLIGGLLAVASAALLASAMGAATNLVWLLPVVLALLAANAPAVPPAPPPARLPLVMDLAGGPVPRITVER